MEEIQLEPEKPSSPKNLIQYVTYGYEATGYSTVLVPQ